MLIRTTNRAGLLQFRSTLAKPWEEEINFKSQTHTITLCPISRSNHNDGQVNLAHNRELGNLSCGDNGRKIKVSGIFGKLNRKLLHIEMIRDPPFGKQCVAARGTGKVGVSKLIHTRAD